MVEVTIKKCTILSTARYCNDCRKILINDYENCPNCKAPYDTLPPVWYIFFDIFEDKNENKQQRLNINALGSILDPIMGFSIKDFLYLKEVFSQIDWDSLVQKYFEKGHFVIFRSDNNSDRIDRMILTAGNKITFRNWISLINDGIDQTTITTTLIQRYVDLSDDDN